MNGTYWEKTKERMAALWEKEVIDHCCIAFTVPRQTEGKEMEMQTDGLEENLIQSYTDPYYVTARHKKIFAETSYYGDAIPRIYPQFGVAGFAQYLGSVPTYMPDTIWLSETLSEPDASQIIFHPEVYEKHLNYVKELVNLSNNQYLITMPSNNGVLDGLAILRGTDSLLMDLLEEPEFVKEAVRNLCEVQKKTFPGFFEAIRENNDGGSSHSWMYVWCPKRVLQLQCDFSVMISPEAYKEFVLPELEAAAEWTDYAVYHLDGQEQIRHLDYILSVDAINMIQWTAVAGQPPASEFIPVFQKMQKHGKGLVLMLQPWEVEKVVTELSSEGLHLVVDGVKTEEEAAELLKIVQKRTHS